MSIPPDDPNRSLTIANADDPSAQHLGLAGDTYTVLVTGKQTAGRYTLIEMRVPHCGGPGPHRHDFEENFTILEGEIEVTFRGEKHVVKAGSTVNIPANAPHFFTNTGGPARMLCLCSPAGQEEFFVEVGTKLASKNDKPAKMSPDEMAAWGKRASEIAPKYRTEIMKPG
jgi:quercetin dioxygenase-like cupin family protein